MQWSCFVVEAVAQPEPQTSQPIIEQATRNQCRLSEQLKLQSGGPVSHNLQPTAFFGVRCTVFVGLKRSREVFGCNATNAAFKSTASHESRHLRKLEQQSADNPTMPDKLST